ncbi:hypothetical protein HDU79_004715 [Rhizoclosmatium sp. JEL0117]|nr:hypothetical protein HDU79_004715 [Rhizoclosmatium sp. JEL0117]
MSGASLARTVLTALPGPATLSSDLDAREAARRTVLQRIHSRAGPAPLGSKGAGTQTSGPTSLRATAAAAAPTQSSTDDADDADFRINDDDPDDDDDDELDDY